MAKQRNSLGLCVLTEPGVTPISWDEYQNRYGIDLSKIFLIYTNVVEGDTHYHVKVNPKFTKLLAIANNYEATEGLPPVVIPNRFALSSTRDPDNSFIYISVMDEAENFGHWIRVFADRTVAGGGENE